MWLSREALHFLVVISSRVRRLAPVAGQWPHLKFLNQRGTDSWQPKAAAVGGGKEAAAGGGGGGASHGTDAELAAQPG